MAVLDTSFIYAFFQPEDVHHQKAKALSQKHEGETHFINFLVFQELVTLITYKKSSQEAYEFGDFLQSALSPIQILKVDEEYLEEYWALAKRLKDHQLSFVDLSLLFLSENFGLPLWSFDQALLQTQKML